MPADHGQLDAAQVMICQFLNRRGYRMLLLRVIFNNVYGMWCPEKRSVAGRCTGTAFVQGRIPLPLQGEGWDGDGFKVDRYLKPIPTLRRAPLTLPLRRAPLTGRP